MKGTFLVAVNEHWLAESETKKTPSVKFKLDVLENVGRKEKADGTLYYDAWLTDKTFDNTMKVLTETLGWNGADLSDLNNSSVLVGAQAWAVVEEEPYQDSNGNQKIASKVKWLNPVGGGQTIEKMEEPMAKTLSEKLKGKILSYRQSKPAPAQQAPVSDGLPF